MKQRNPKFEIWSMTLNDLYRELQVMSKTTRGDPSYYERCMAELNSLVESAVHGRECEFGLHVEEERRSEMTDHLDW